jgi:hypothetical protein
MAPKVQDLAWIHVDLVDEEIYCKYCKNCMGGGIHRLKEHLSVIRGQVAPCMAPLEEIGQIRLELQNQRAKFEEDKDRKKEMVVACFLDSRV